jgi:chitin synthase
VIAQAATATWCTLSCAAQLDNIYDVVGYAATKEGSLTWQYNENNPSFPPPPIAMPASEHIHSSRTLDGSAAGYNGNTGKTLGMDEMAAMLDQEWDEPAPPARAASPLPPLQAGRANAYAGGSGPGSATSPLQSRHGETIPLNRWDPSMGSGSGSGASSGFGDAGGYGYTSAPQTASSRSRGPPQIHPTPRSAGVNGYGPGSTIASASGVERAHGSGHAKKRSGGRAKGSDEYEYQDARDGYGPMGPLSDWEPRSGAGAGAGAGMGSASGKGKRI